MIEHVLRHWILIDLQRFRDWATPGRIKYAKQINNYDGTFGAAFDVRSFDSAMIIAASDTMRVAMAQGMQAIEPLETAAPRKLMKPPSLQEMVQQHGGYDRITPEAWAAHDRAMASWKAALRFDQARVP